MSNHAVGSLLKKHAVLFAGALIGVSCALDSPPPDAATGGAAGASGQAGLGAGGSAFAGKGGVAGSAVGGDKAGGDDSAGMSGSGGSAGASGGGGGSSGQGAGGDESAAGSAAEAGAGGEGGTSAEPDGDDCLGVVCQNEGTCVDGVRSHTCACTDRYTGPACEFLEFKQVGTDFYLGEQTRVTALSNDGSVALLNVTGDGGDWVAKFVDFESLVGVEFTGLQASGRYAFGINEDGTVIAGQVVQGGPSYVPFKLVGSTPSLLDLDPLPLPGTGSNALDVSADGTTIVGASNDSETGTTEAFRYRAEGSEYVGNREAGEAAQSARAVSGDGSVVAGVATGANSLPVRAWRWVDGVTTTLELKGAAWARPMVNDISRDGRVIVGEVSINGVVHAARWTGSSATIVDLGTGVALGTNADGSVIVGHDNSGNAVVWTGTTKRTLSSILGTNPDITGTLTAAVGVSDDGKVVAGDLVADGTTQGFMARLP